jgi:hypothetical protein
MGVLESRRSMAILASLAKMNSCRRQGLNGVIVEIRYDTARNADRVLQIMAIGKQKSWSDRLRLSASVIPLSYDWFRETSYRTLLQPSDWAPIH